MLWVIGFGSSGIIGSLIAAVLGAIVVIYVVDYFKKRVNAGGPARPAVATGQPTFWSLFVVVTTGVVVVVLQPGLEALDALGDVAHDTRNLARAEDDHDHQAGR